MEKIMIPNIAGIKRKADYSPNHVENDTLLLKMVTNELEAIGANVTIYKEEEIRNDNIPENIIFSMARGIRANNFLSKMVKNGKLIINPPETVFNCYRVNLVKTLSENKIPLPKSFIVNVNEPESVAFAELGTKKIWIKRGDIHAIHREDVTLCYSEEEKNFILREFARRGIKKAILQANLPGDVIKFYSIKNSELFFWYYLNGGNHNNFDQDKLKIMAENAADVLDIEIYGGDVVITEDGSITFVDLNDWPSFAPVRDKASRYIAKLIFEKAGRYAK